MINDINRNKWNDSDIDAAYLMGVINASCHEIDLTESFPTLAIVSKEIERLKSLGYKRPYEAVMTIRKGKPEEQNNPQPIKEKLIDKVAIYLDKYRKIDSMTSHRLARTIVSFLIIENETS